MISTELNAWAVRIPDRPAVTPGGAWSSVVMRHWRRLLDALFLRLGLLIVWVLLLGVFASLSPGPAAVWVAAVLIAFLLRYALSASRRGTRERAAAYARPLGANGPYALVAAIALAVAYVPWQVLYAVSLPAPHQSASVTQVYFERPMGWLPVVLATIVAAPIIEEFAFRGWIQRLLTRALRPSVAIILSAMLFAAVHLSVREAGYHFVSGLLFGIVVYRARSVWAGVLVHVAANAGSRILSVATSDADPDQWPRLLGHAWPVLIVAGVIGCGAFAWAVMRIRPSSRLSCV